MTTIAVDPKVKQRAAKRAKDQDGLPLSAVVTIFLNDYASGKISVGSQSSLTVNGFTPEFEDEILATAKEFENNKYSFNTPQEAVDFLSNRI